MSARQPFLPSRPASRALNPGDDVNAALTNPPSNANDTAELGVKLPTQLEGDTDIRPA